MRARPGSLALRSPSHPPPSTAATVAAPGYMPDTPTWCMISAAVHTTGTAGSGSRSAGACRSQPRNRDSADSVTTMVSGSALSGCGGKAHGRSVRVILNLTSEG